MGTVRIIGLGNTWAGDDGVGLTAAGRIRERNLPGIQVSCCETPCWEMFEGMGPDDLLIIIDACESRARPGMIHHLNVEDLMGAGMRHCSSHGLGLAHWLSMAQILGAEMGRIIVYGIEITQTEMGAGLSKPVMAAVAEVCDRIAETVAGYTESAHA